MRISSPNRTHAERGTGRHAAGPFSAPWRAASLGRMDLIDDPATAGNAPEFTVSELSGAVKRLIEGEFSHVRIRAEVGRVSRPRSGHVYLDLKDEFWEGYLAGRKEIGRDIYKIASELVKSPRLEFLPQTKQRRGRGGLRPKVGEKYIFQPVLMDITDPIVIKGKAIKPGSTVRVTKAEIDPRRLFVYVEDDQGNEM